jgi:hypothetical protein
MLVEEQIRRLHCRRGSTRTERTRRVRSTNRHAVASSMQKSHRLALIRLVAHVSARCGSSATSSGTIPISYCVDRGVSLSDDGAGAYICHVRTCFVLLPFRALFDRYYEMIIAPAIAAQGLTAMRGDSLFRSSPIMDDVWQMIRDAKFIVAELTSQNANVFYELGLAHAAGKPVILLSETMEDVPFDLQALPVITYDRHDPNWGQKVQRRLTEAIQHTLVDPVNAIPSIFRQDHDGPNSRVV